MPITSGGGAHFLAFLHEELFPFINARYRTVPDDRTLSCYSYGGTFGVFTLFNRPETFQRLLPQPLQVADPGYTADEGIGIHWQRHLKPGVPRDSKRDEDLLFGPKALGHGSFSGCIFFIDPDLELVVVQVRKQSGPRSAEWSPKFYQAIAKVISE